MCCDRITDRCARPVTARPGLTGIDLPECAVTGSPASVHSPFPAAPAARPSANRPADPIPRQSRHPDGQGPGFWPKPPRQTDRPLHHPAWRRQKQAWIMPSALAVADQAPGPRGRAHVLPRPIASFARQASGTAMMGRGNAPAMSRRNANRPQCTIPRPNAAAHPFALKAARDTRGHPFTQAVGAVRSGSGARGRQVHPFARAHGRSLVLACARHTPSHARSVARRPKPTVMSPPPHTSAGLLSTACPKDRPPRKSGEKPSRRRSRHSCRIMAARSCGHTPAPAGSFRFHTALLRMQRGAQDMFGRMDDMRRPSHDQRIGRGHDRRILVRIVNR